MVASRGIAGVAVVVAGRVWARDGGEADRQPSSAATTSVRRSFVRIRWTPRASHDRRGEVAFDADQRVHVAAVGAVEAFAAVEQVGSGGLRVVVEEIVADEAV